MILDLQQASFSVVTTRYGNFSHGRCGFIANRHMAEQRFFAHLYVDLRRHRQLRHARTCNNMRKAVLRATNKQRQSDNKIKANNFSQQIIFRF